MSVQLGAHVRTRDGKDVGSIERLIVEPASGEVKAAVIRKGFILTEDIQIPRSALQEGGEGEARLSYTADEVKELPRFHQADYTAPPAEYVSPFGYPSAALLWPVDYVLPVPTAPTVPPAESDEALRQRGVNLDDVVIAQGSDVIARDGEKVGEIHSITFDPPTGRPTKFVIRRGFLFTEDVELPAEAIEHVTDGVVYLQLDKEQIKSHSEFVV
jgi:sporulation protein YlmC with PRC-barrel domain